MSLKPDLGQRCHEQACYSHYNLAYNSGWGAVTSNPLNLPAAPRSAVLSGNCDDYAILWINGVCVYNPGGCSCGGSCCSPYSVEVAGHLREGANTIQHQCVDQCGGSSGDQLAITLQY